MPAGLADGLALKKLRYGPESDSPPEPGRGRFPMGPPSRLHVGAGFGVFI